MSALVDTTATLAIREAPVVEVDPDSIAPNRAHIFMRVSNKDEKFQTLVDILCSSSAIRTIIFVKERDPSPGGGDHCTGSVDGLERAFNTIKTDGTREYPYLSFTTWKGKGHDNEAATGKFIDKECPIMIATNIAARCIDVDDVELVICLDVSLNQAHTLGVDHLMYTHKVGRTARAGKPGVALSLVIDGSESTAIESVVDNLKKEVAKWEFLPITPGREPNTSIGEVKYGDHSIAPKPGSTDKTIIFEWHKDDCKDPLQSFIGDFKRDAKVSLNLSTDVKFQEDDAISIIGEAGYEDMDQPTKVRFDEAPPRASTPFTQSELPLAPTALSIKVPWPLENVDDSAPYGITRLHLLSDLLSNLFKGQRTSPALIMEHVNAFNDQGAQIDKVVAVRGDGRCTTTVASALLRAWKPDLQVTDEDIRTGLAKDYFETFGFSTPQAYLDSVQDVNGIDNEPVFVHLAKMFSVACVCIDVRLKVPNIEENTLTYLPEAYQPRVTPVLMFMINGGHMYGLLTEAIPRDLPSYFQPPEGELHIKRMRVRVRSVV